MGKPLMSTTHIVAFLAFLLTVGCTTVERAAQPASPPAEPSMAGPADQGPAKSEASISQPSAEVSASPVPAQRSGKKGDGVTHSGKPASAPPLDLATLEKRLRETEAIGVFTKIALKNQVDDLLNKFRAFYQGKTRSSLAELRQPYDMLLLKVLSLLQDGDPGLARAIVASRETIWGMLADPNKFATL